VKSATSIATDPTLEDVFPYTKLLAAVFALAAQDARSGDAEAREWINREGTAIASLQVATSVDPALVMQRLMQRSP
jgi:hypothetical protein